MIELKNSKTTYLGKASGRDKYSLDAFIGAVQMREPGGQWADIRPQLVRDADGWHVTGAPYYAGVKDDGTRLFCPDNNERLKYLRLPAPVLFSGLSRNIVSNPTKLDSTFLPNQLTIPADWGEFRIIFSNTGMHFEVLFTKAPPANVFGKDSPRITLDAESSGYDIESLLESTSGIGIPRPRIISANPEVVISEGQERWLDWNYKNGQLELGFDFGDLQFPILLKNTTVDVQVGASADDGYVYSEGIGTSADYIMVGNDYGYVKHCFARYTGVTIPQGSTIGVCYWTVWEYTTSGTPYTNVYLELADNPSAITSWADYLSRNLTTNYAAWDGDPGPNAWYNSDSLVSAMQEITDAYDLNNGAIQVMQKDDGSSTARRRSCSYDYGDHSLAPKLHIEYTAGGATEKTAAETGSGAEASSLLGAMAKTESGGGADARLSLLAGHVKGDNGSGIEQSVLTSSVAKISAETGSGVDVAGLIVGLISGETGLGTDAGLIIGVKQLFSGDGGVSADALKALIAVSGSGADMKLPGRPGQVRIPSKGVSL